MIAIWILRYILRCPKPTITKDAAIEMAKAEALKRGWEYKQIGAFLSLYAWVVDLDVNKRHSTKIYVDITTGGISGTYRASR